MSVAGATSARTWSSRFAQVTLHSFTDDTLRLYYVPRPGAPTETSDFDLTALFEALPGLKRHRCDNGHHQSFAQEARHTEIAHLFEHLLVELLAQSGRPRADIQGATNLDEAPVRYRVKVSGWADVAAQFGELVKNALQILDSQQLTV